MPGWLSSTLPDAASPWGGEEIAVDKFLPNGQFPQTERWNFQQLAAAMNFFANNADKTTVSGTRYCGSWNLNAPSPSAGDGGAVEAAPLFTATGIAVLVGSVGGTDNWIVELHNSAGAVVANSALAGTLAGTAGTWQQIPFTAPVSLPPDTYFLVLQSNGTTAHPKVYNFPATVAQLPKLLTAAPTGVFGTLASITPPTTYTAGQAPVAMLY